MIYWFDFLMIRFYLTKSYSKLYNELKVIVSYIKNPKL